MRRTMLLILALLLLAGCSSGGIRQTTYTNPVYNHDAPDPTVIRAADGSFYAYTTESTYGQDLKIFPILKSRDMTSWQMVGQVFSEPPAWTITDFWAPHILMRNGKYYLYYAAKARDTGTTAIGVAVADSPSGPFKDKGSPVILGGGFSTIDPFILVDGEQLYIYWGSDRVPILVQELTPDGMDVVGSPDGVLFPSDQFGGYERLVEGPWVIKHGEYYYLMYSGDDCCDKPHYAMLVARSKSPKGPFEKAPNNPILAAGDRWDGPGHNAAIQDDAGDWWLLYHAMDKQSGTRDRVMVLDKLTWQADGWPARLTPSRGKQAGPQWKNVRR